MYTEVRNTITGTLRVQFSHLSIKQFENQSKHNYFQHITNAQFNKWRTHCILLVIISG